MSAPPRQRPSSPPRSESRKLAAETAGLILGLDRKLKGMVEAWGVGSFLSPHPCPQCGVRLPHVHLKTATPSPRFAGASLSPDASRGADFPRVGALLGKRTGPGRATDWLWTLWLPVRAALEDAWGCAS